MMLFMISGDFFGISFFLFGYQFSAFLLQELPHSGGHVKCINFELRFCSLFFLSLNKTHTDYKWKLLTMWIGKTHPEKLLLLRVCLFDYSEEQNWNCESCGGFSQMTFFEKIPFKIIRGAWTWHPSKRILTCKHEDWKCLKRVKSRN